MPRGPRAPTARLALASVIAVVLLAGCGSKSAPVNSAPMLLAQWSGQHGGGEGPSTRLLRQSGDWSAFWQQVARDRPRELETAHEMAVVIEIGGRRTGGFRAEITGVRAEEGKLVIDYREHVPAPGMMVMQVLTAPWVAAVLTRSDLPVVFRRVGPAGRPVQDN